jgi:hypothetical protein
MDSLFNVKQFSCCRKWQIIDDYYNYTTIINDYYNNQMIAITGKQFVKKRADLLLSRENSY